jgi:HK97 family phage prohead protease
VELKHKNVSVSGVKVVDAEKGIVEAFVAGIGNKDSQKDIIQPGAFTESLAGRNPKCVWSHQWDLPVGKCLAAYEVSAGSDELPTKMKDAGCGGLYTKTQFNLGTERGRDAFADVQFYGDEQEWSIGYAEEKAQWSKDLDANLVHKVGLYEYSPVLFGANSATATATVKEALGALRELHEKDETVETIELSGDDLALLSEYTDDDPTPAPEAKDDALEAPESDAPDPVGVPAVHGEPGDSELTAVGIVADAAAHGNEAAQAWLDANSPAGDSEPKAALTGTLLKGGLFTEWLDAQHAKAVAAVDLPHLVEGGTGYAPEERTANTQADVTKAYGVPGSYERFICEATDSARDALDGMDWVVAVATTADSIVVCWERPEIEMVAAGDGYFYPQTVGWEMGYAQFALTVTNGVAEVTGDPVPVEIVQQVRPVAGGGGDATAGDQTTTALSDELFAALCVKVGRVLSQANYDRIGKASEHLTAVLDSAGDGGEKAEPVAQVDPFTLVKDMHDYKGDGGPCKICDQPADDEDQHYGAGDDAKSAIEMTEVDPEDLAFLDQLVDL